MEPARRNQGRPALFLGLWAVLHAAVEAEMANRLLGLVLVAVLLVAGGIALRPYVEYRLYAATAPRPVEPRGDLAEYERSTIALFERVSPSVVQVVGLGNNNARNAPPRGGEEQAAVQSGTGFVWDAAGHVVTNDHVVEGATNLAVRLSSGEAVRAQLVGVAPNYDLAVIRLEGVRQMPPPISVGSSADLKVGQAAFAIGNPFGLDQSLTTGIISALKRRLPTQGGREISNVIQTDAAINPGNSGGPLLDSSGRLIGVNTAIYSPSGSNAGIGFAIPVDVVNRIVPELIKNGRVPTPGIGIVAAGEDVATRMGVEGVVIVRTVPGSPAEKAGLKGVNQQTGALGDVIVAANDTPVRRLGDLTDELERVGVGKKIQLSLNRGGSKASVAVDITDISQSR
jgi:2-alkenal reductase